MPQPLRFQTKLIYSERSQEASLRFGGQRKQMKISAAVALTWQARHWRAVTASSLKRWIKSRFKFFMTLCCTGVLRGRKKNVNSRLWSKPCLIHVTSATLFFLRLGLWLYDCGCYLDFLDIPKDNSVMLLSLTCELDYWLDDGTCNLIHLVGLGYPSLTIQQ